MLFLLLSLSLLCLSALLTVFCNARPERANFIGAAGAVSASAVGLFPAVRTLLHPAAETLRLPWPVPMASFSLTLDPLAAFFLVPVFILTAAAAIYGAGYFRPEEKKALGLAWTAFNLLSAAMAVVFLAANAVLFMLAWEVMAVSSFFLVIFDHEKAQARKAAYIYLVAGAAGALALMFAFSLLGAHAGALDFAAFKRPEGPLAAAAFLSFLLGFGLKAGVIPLHVWLPEAHPAAPSHVSAVMSGVMIKTGIYGLIRALGLLSPWAPWWGWTLILIGLVSCLLGVVFALAQHDLKRLLAYSSIENIGIIVLALGLGVLGTAMGLYPLAALAFGGALLHVLNHALFKGLLFMGAGAVLHGAGTAEIEALGGLARRMPRAAFLFVLGAAAACALPPLNGFAGEFLIYLGAFSALNGPANIVLAALLALAVLSAAGALALAVFSKAAGSVFLGEPRTQAAAGAHDCGPLMNAGMTLLAAACVVSGFAAPFLILPVSTALGAAFGLRTTLDFSGAAATPLIYLTAAFLALAAIAWVLAEKRRFFLGGRQPAAGPTWDCGYAAPSARMQYGASSFSQPLTAFFQPLLKKTLNIPVIAGYFPGKASFSSEARSVVFDHLYAPVIVRLRGLAFRFSWLQHGRLQFYILYIVAALMALLLWKL